MRRIISLLAVLMLAAGLYGCGEKEVKNDIADAGEQVETSVEKETAVVSTPEETQSVESDTEVPFGSYIFTISDKYRLAGFDDGNLKYEMGEGLSVEFGSIGEACSDEEFILYKYIFEQGLAGENENIETEEITLADNEGVIIIVNDSEYYAVAVLINDTAADMLECVTLECRDSSLTSYVDEFLDMIKHGVTTREPVTGEPSDNKSDTDSTLVNPELKEFLDSYEAFIDEYIVFMNNYSESQNPLAMLSDYTNYLQKYAEMAEKAEQYDSDTMSDADALYYSEVMFRISAKLMKSIS